MISYPSARQQRTLLITHFLKSFFNSELMPRQAEARDTLIQILALVATPGFIIMCCLLRKPQLFIPFFAVSFTLLLAAAAYRNRLIGRLSAFRFEADAAPVAEPLSLG